MAPRLRGIPMEHRQPRLERETICWTSDRSCSDTDAIVA